MTESVNQLYLLKQWFFSTQITKEMCRFQYEPSINSTDSTPIFPSQDSYPFIGRKSTLSPWLFKKFWISIVSLHCVNFCCTRKWISYMFTCIPSLLHFLPSPTSISPPSHPPKSPQSTELSSLCSTVVPTSYSFYTWQCI